MRISSSIFLLSLLYLPFSSAVLGRSNANFQCGVKVSVKKLAIKTYMNKILRIRSGLNGKCNG
ncbi:Bgt-5608 [Blumeria graminis f. sp. tritici]|uniref:Bgt-5608 n=3 Tax=Blumeria graminis TaxID=34373 RepID=A0A381L6S2_BLUGR|nr:hypothetical protein BGT96224_5608 [Blumeria graminis f. sp. tritici 96224]VDB89656.1 Bgt-5608 [Blumeria graminis f. sp. tritici]